MFEFDPKTGREIEKRVCQKRCLHYMMQIKPFVWFNENGDKSSNIFEDNFFAHILFIEIIFIFGSLTQTCKIVVSGSGSRETMVFLSQLRNNFKNPFEQYYSNISRKLFIASFFTHISVFLYTGNS